MVVDLHALDLVRAALADELGDAGDRLVVVGDGPRRRRSRLSFLGLADDPSRPTKLTEDSRWVLKQPNSEVSQQDLASPLSAEQQYEALCRLHAHLVRTGSAVAVPRPVAYLPELAGYLMEYVPGPTLTSLVGPRAVARPAPLLRALDGAAEVLHAVHSMPDGPDGRRAGRSGEASSPGAVVLHGDFAPENVVLGPGRLYCLEPDLDETGPPERDVVRFLLMLFDAPFFVLGADVVAVRRLRRRAAARFLTAYYGDRPWPSTLRPLMREAVRARWAMRHTDVVDRGAALAGPRLWLLRRHFSVLLDEVGAPYWPEGY